MDGEIPQLNITKDVTLLRIIIFCAGDFPVLRN